MGLRIFDLHGTEKLTEWKRFRETLEVSKKPFEDLSEFWAFAPFVNRYLDADDSSSWPDPWKLILDNKFDDLAISLGMLYTLSLTKRFERSEFVIRQTTDERKKSFLIVDNNSILNWEYRSVNRLEDLERVNSTVLWTKIEKI